MTTTQPWQFFPQRISSPARAKMALPYRSLDDPEKSDHIKKLLNGSPGELPKALYIHIPFCKQNCRFCGYYKTHGWADQDIDAYIDGLCRQLENLKSTPWVQQSTFDALYFGGGTPSVLGKAAFSKLIDRIKSSITLSPDAEITVELTLNHATKEYVEVLRDLEINRISLGVQSFDSYIRRGLGRITDGQKAKELIQMIHDAGIQNICIDLIYGLPNQTIKEWESDLKTLRTLPVTGCSVYPLIPFPNSAMVIEKEFKPLSNEEAFTYFSMADDFLLDLKDWEVFSPVQYGHKVNGTAKYISLTGLQGDVLALVPSSGGNMKNYQYLSKYPLDACLDQSFDFLINSQWSIIDPKFLKLFSLFQISEGQGLSISDLETLGSNLHELSDEEWFNLLITVDSEKIKVNKTGRFWAGNISSIISQKIAQKF